MKNIDELLKQIQFFSEDVLELHPPASIENILEFEKKLNLQLPDDYKYMLSFHDGLSLMGTEIYGIGGKTNPSSLDKIYFFEHEEVGNPMPEYLIPFSPDGGGNHYCFDLRSLNHDSCSIIFWQHDLDYSKENPEVVNESFAAWVKEVVIEWKLEDYDYDGNKKTIL